MYYSYLYTALFIEQDLTPKLLFVIPFLTIIMALLVINNYLITKIYFALITILYLRSIYFYGCDFFIFKPIATGIDLLNIIVFFVIFVVSIYCLRQYLVFRSV